MGFKVFELSHNEEFILGGDFKIKILAADDCRPEICGKSFGCIQEKVELGSNWIDSMCLVYDKEYCILNTNDCPFEMSKDTLELVKDQKEIDLLLVGYAGAGPYPQCFPKLNRLELAEQKKNQFYNQTLKFLKFVNPKYYMPFAGRYILSGNLTKLNKYRGVDEPEDAVSYLSSKTRVKPILLNSEQEFSLVTEKSSKTYEPVDSVQKELYIKKITNMKFDFESDEYPLRSKIHDLLLCAFRRFSKAIKTSKSVLVQVYILSWKKGFVYSF